MIISSLSRSFTSTATGLAPASYSRQRASTSAPARPHPAPPSTSLIRTIAASSAARFASGDTLQCGVMSPTIASATSWTMAIRIAADASTPASGAATIAIRPMRCMWSAIDSGRSTP
jgi:hypothetical protein